ncbi:hypothetical protein VOLCADRAFT_96025 [Volvox carteri f. nagariensis]|uniref:Uncharacterized protein n=1 Tax=Volvox carteri f. nagariensis TaxID=3068 RepID=D8U905_VOLCA|nr:uncharacterized protein VOLCADRAFT_96025 [Volvox carteri f. nagariensis]XP_002959654.1 uncharacterized protein VOLCADRAFT_101158 [Volvox carteri f. nagariensis]EFJ39280.1 hypothetical protein VOLCADRAFT_101158 [Volvox carteri f. nagariensis]EFJ43899.1 hypothetical protein VOLCADRAFT_96025 [Volvox carteri f. nagariensis]|eukprot:XP_002955145.1 hypothetical protein VOLCADRAFT_96025 [Volvox carteri f. nagariensis]
MHAATKRKAAAAEGAVRNKHANSHGLMLNNEAGRVLAAILSWPSQYTLSASNEGTFLRAYEVCEKLCDVGGLCGEDFTDPRRQAATVFTDQLVTVLKEGPKPLKPVELQRLSAGLAAMCGGGRGRAKKPKRSSMRCCRTSTTPTDRILDDFRDDFLATSIFENIKNLKPCLAKIVADFGGVDKVASLVGMKRHEKVTEDLVFDKLHGATKTKWRNTRHLKKGGVMGFETALHRGLKIKLSLFI